MVEQTFAFCLQTRILTRLSVLRRLVEKKCRGKEDQVGDSCVGDSQESRGVRVKKSDNPFLDLSARSLAGVVQSVLLDQCKTGELAYFYSSNLP